MLADRSGNCSPDNAERVLPDPAVSSVADNGQQPRSSVCSTESFKPSQRSDVRLLNNVLGVLVSFDDPSRQIVRSIKVRKEKFLEKRLCVSHLRQDHAIWILFPDQVFFFPAALSRLFLSGGPGSAAYLNWQRVGWSGIARSS
jgi:hypothetical protein